MPKTVDSQVLLYNLERLNKRILEISLRDFTPLNSKQLNWRKTPYTWSILECLAHINYVADIYFPPTLKAIKNATKKGSSPQKNFTPSWLGDYYARKIRLQADNQIKKQIETHRKYVPTLDDKRELNSRVVFDNFVKNQQQLGAFLAEAKVINIEKTRVYTEVFGFVSVRLGDILRTLVYHDERHLVQAQRIHYHDYFPGNLPLDLLLSVQNQSLSPDA